MIFYGLFLLIILLSAMLIYKNNPGRSSGGSFTVILLPDTQKYAKRYPDIFCSQTDWIVENKSKLNIELVLQLGDIVDSGAEDLAEWEVAKRCMMKLQGVVPWSVLPGNHDTDVASDKTSGLETYDSYFPASLFKGFSWYKEGYKDNRNSFLVVEPLGMRIGLLNLSIEPEDDVLKWAKEKIDENPDAYFIVATHKYLQDDGKGRDKRLDFGPVGNTGEDIWQKLVKENCKIGLVINGHFNHGDGEDRLVSKNECKGDVMQIAQDYQSREMGGAGRLRIYTFRPSKHKVEVRTYSPYTNTFETDDDSQFEFALP